VDKLNGNEYSLVSDTVGVVESVKVYRGTALVKAGDTVGVGDILVDGVVTVKDQTLKTNVLATVSIIVEVFGEYRSKEDNQEEKAVLFALFDCGEVEVLSSAVQKSEKNGEYLYKTTVKYRRVLSAM
jgi:hypothetical protein